MAAFAAQVWAADNRAPNFSVVDEIVAKVNGDIVTKSELEKNSREVMAALQQQGLKGNDLQQAVSAAGKGCLRDRIDQLLLVQRAKDLNINVDTEVSKYMADLQRQEKIADPDKFHELCVSSRDAFEDFRQDVKNNMMTRNVIGQEVARKINVSTMRLRLITTHTKASSFERKRSSFAKSWSPLMERMRPPPPRQRRRPLIYTIAQAKANVSLTWRATTPTQLPRRKVAISVVTPKVTCRANLENIVWTMKARRGHQTHQDGTWIPDPEGRGSSPKLVKPPSPTWKTRSAKSSTAPACNLKFENI